MSPQTNPFVVLGPKPARERIVTAIEDLEVHFPGHLDDFEDRVLTVFELSRDAGRELPANWDRHPMCDSLLAAGRSMIAAVTEHRRWGLAPFAFALPIYSRLLAEIGKRPGCILGVTDPTLLSTPLEVGIWLREVIDGIRFNADGLPQIVALNLPGADICGSLSSCGFDDDEVARVADRFACEAPAGAAYPVPEFIRRVYRWCCDAKRNTESLDPLLREFDAWRAMLAPPKLPGTRIGFAWHARGRTESALEPFMPSGDWQTVQLTLDAPPESEVNGLLYCRPCRVWIRRFLLDGQPVRIAAGPGSVLSPQGQLLRLDGAYEARQITFQTPNKTGSYLLEIEFFLESGPRIAAASIARSAESLHRCLAFRTGTRIREGA